MRADGGRVGRFSACRLGSRRRIKVDAKAGQAETPTTLENTGGGCPA